MDFQALVGDADVRYFSLGRYALAAGLRLLNLTPGTPVLVPAFICRDLLAAVHVAGGTPVFYPVSETMEPATPPEEWPHAAAVLAVNYFGFPQSLAVFQRYCERTGACLIEDNAHGLLSRDHTGQFLGTRGDLGIFSLRKTMPVPDGAALVVKRSPLRSHMEAQLAADANRSYRAFATKRRLASIPIIGGSATRLAVTGTRLWRKLRTGKAIPVPDADIEIRIPGNPAPYAGLLEAQAGFNVERECQRRHALYIAVNEKLRAARIRPVFATMSPNMVPYGLPFFGDADDAVRVNSAVRSLNLEAFRWPELPAAVVDTAPMHYRSVWWVNFLAQH